MRLYILRHGETEWNTKRKLQGQTDIELNEKGRTLAAETGRNLRKVPFSLVISSPLKRAVETARLVIGERDVPLITDPRICEIGFGIMEGIQVRGEDGSVLDPDYYNFFHHPEKYRPKKGGEELDALCRRTASFLDELKSQTRWQEKTILISTHGAAARALLTAIKDTPRKDFWETGVPRNCAVTIVDLEKEQWIIKEQDVVYYENV